MLSSRFSIDLIKFPVILRKKNARLKKELQEAEADKREIFNHASSVDHAFALSKIRNEQMTKTNSTLLADNNKRKKEGRSAPLVERIIYSQAYILTPTCLAFHLFRNSV